MMREQCDGWGAHSKPIIVLVDSCGCKWTRDGKARLSVCTACLSAAVKRDVERMSQ